MLSLGGIGDPGIGELTATLVAKIDIGNTESPSRSDIAVEEEDGRNEGGHQQAFDEIPRLLLIPVLLLLHIRGWI